MHRPILAGKSVAAFLAIACCFAFFNSAALADTDAGAQQSRSYEQLLADLAREKQNIEKLKQRDAGDNRLLEAAIFSRLLQARMNLMESNLDFLSQVAEDEKTGQAGAERRQQANRIYSEQLQAIDTTTRMISEKIVPPAEQLPAAETAAVYSRIFSRIDELNRVYRIYVSTLEEARALAIDVAAETEKLKQSLLDRAENGSVLLEMAIAEISALRASVSAVPGDTETRARLNVVSAHVADLADGISQILEMMKSLDMDTSQFQNQLLLATGQITTDIFQVDVFTNLFLGWSETLWAQVIENGPGLVFNLLLLIIIVFIFYKLAGVVQRITERALDDARVELSQLLKRMVVSIARNTVLVIGILIALSQIGISLGPLLAGMGLVGFIVCRISPLAC